MSVTRLSTGPGSNAPVIPVPMQSITSLRRTGTRAYCSSHHISLDSFNTFHLCIHNRYKVITGIVNFLVPDNVTCE